MSFAPSFPSNAKAFPPGDWRNFRLASCGNHTGQGVERPAGGEHYRPYATTRVFPYGPMFPLDDTRRLQVLRTDLFNHVEEMQARWLSSGGIDHEWDAYIARLKEMGLEEFIAIHQRNYDRLFGRR